MVSSALRIRECYLLKKNSAAARSGRCVTRTGRALVRPRYFKPTPCLSPGPSGGSLSALGARLGRADIYASAQFNGCHDQAQGFGRPTVRGRSLSARGGLFRCAFRSENKIYNINLVLCVCKREFQFRVISVSETVTDAACVTNATTKE